MKIRSRALLNLASLLTSAVIRRWMGTLDYRVALYDPTVDPAHPRFAGPMIYVFWHEYILIPLVHRGNNNVAILLSQHGDADVLERMALHFGFGTVRGSTRRGGAAALWSLRTAAQGMNLAITPDGPLGPRRRLEQGPVYLASATGLPIVTMGFGYDRPWRLPTWDQFAIPRPGSRCRSVVGPPMYIPPNLDRAGLEHYRQVVEQMLLRMTLESEAWAESGTTKTCERSVRREFKWHPPRRRDAAHAHVPVPLSSRASGCVAQRAG